MDEAVTVEPHQAVREASTDRGEGQMKKRAPGGKFETVRLAASCAHWEAIVRAVADTRGHSTTATGISKLWFFIQCPFKMALQPHVALKLSPPVQW